MKMKIVLFSPVFFLVIVLSSCGVFLGPVSDLSLQQRMEKGWKLAYSFTTTPIFSPLYANNCRLLISKKQPGDIMVFYLESDGTTSYVYYFTTNSYGNYAYYPCSGLLPNKMDATYNKSDNSLIFYNTSSLYLFKDNTTVTWSCFNSVYISNDMLIADTNTIIGVSYNLYSTILKTKFDDFSSTNTMVTLPGWMSSTRLNKCRNRYNNDTVIYATYTDSNTNSMLELISLNNFSGFMLNDPMNLSNNTPIIESDGKDRLYMMLSNSIYRYDSASRSFVNEYKTSFNLTDVSNSFYSADFIGDNLVVIDHQYNMVTNPIMILSYNASAKTGSVMKFLDAQTNLGQVIGLDLFYDKDNNIAYAAVLYYDMNVLIHGFLYTSQM